MKSLNLLSSIKSFAAHKFKKEKKPFVYVAIGDSTVAGMGASSPEKHFAYLIYDFIKQENPDAQFHNLGEVGARVEDVLKRQINQALRLEPDLILVSVGANDVMQRRRLKTFDAEYNLLMERLSESKAMVLVNNIPDLSVAPIIPKIVTPYAFIQTIRYNQMIKKHSNKRRFTYIDLHSQSKAFRGLKELISEDGLHPSDAGYALWATAIIKILQPLNIKPKSFLKIFN